MISDLREAEVVKGRGIEASGLYKSNYKYDLAGAQDTASNGLLVADESKGAGLIAPTAVISFRSREDEREDRRRADDHSWRQI